MSIQPVTDHRSLRDRFAALHAERAATWSSEALARNAHQRRLLVARAEQVAHPAPGAPLPDFTLIDAAGALITRDSLLANGPAVLVWFRFGGCPACNIALPYYDAALWPALAATGIPLLAVSPQVPVAAALAARLRFPVVSDPNYRLSRQLGLTFFPEDQPVVAAGEPWIGAMLGTDSYEMSQPAVLVINRDGTLGHLGVSPDWLERPDAETILGWVRAASAVSA